MVAILVILDIALWFLMVILAPAQRRRHAIDDNGGSQASFGAILLPLFYTATFFLLNDSDWFKSWLSPEGRQLISMVHLLLITAASGALVRLIALGVFEQRSDIRGDLAGVSLVYGVTRGLISGGIGGLAATMSWVGALAIDYITLDDDLTIVLGLVLSLLFLGLGLGINIRLAKQEHARQLGRAGK